VSFQPLGVEEAALFLQTRVGLTIHGCTYRPLIGLPTVNIVSRVFIAQGQQFDAFVSLAAVPNKIQQACSSAVSPKTPIILGGRGFRD
jgi:hypothetical protein